MKATYLFAKVLAFALAVRGCSKEPTSASKAAFAAQLTGGEQVPSVTTATSGTPSFWLNPAGMEIRCKLTVADRHNGTMAHLHLGAPDKNG